MEWRQLLSTKRSRGTSGRRGTGSDLRSEFEKDYQRIIGSASFRRLQDKTQVFPLDKSDFIRENWDDEKVCLDRETIDLILEEVGIEREIEIEQTEEVER